MPDYFSNDRRGRKRDGRGLADAPRGRGRTPGLAVVVCVIVALVHAQPTLPGDHGQEQAEQVTAPWTVTEWDDLMVPGVFAVTPGIWVTEVGGRDTAPSRPWSGTTRAPAIGTPGIAAGTSPSSIAARLSRAAGGSCM